MCKYIYINIHTYIHISLCVHARVKKTEKYTPPYPLGEGKKKRYSIIGNKNTKLKNQSRK